MRGSTPAAQRVADELNGFQRDSVEQLARLNEAFDTRATMLWLWSPSAAPAMPSFHSLFGLRGAVVGGLHFLRGIGLACQMLTPEVPGATGYLDSNLAGKAAAATALLEEVDVIVIHLNAADEEAHKRSLEGKIAALELFDEVVVGPVIRHLRARYPGGHRVAVLPDHYTCVEDGRHLVEPVPCLVYGTGVAPDASRTFGEREAAARGSFTLRASDLMPRLVGEQAWGGNNRDSARERESSEAKRGRSRSYAEIVASTNPVSNWSKFAVHPFADRVLWVLVNFLPIHPNVLTVVHGLIGFAAALCFARGDRAGLAAGGALFYISFALDAIDGALARMIGKTSALGAWLDTITDFARSVAVAAGLSIGTYRFTGDIRALYLGLGVTAVSGLYYYLAEVTHRHAGARPAAMAGSSHAGGTFAKLGLVPSPFGLPDYEAVCFVIFPLVGRPMEGMMLAVSGGVLSRLAVIAIVFRRLAQTRQEKS